jgi:bifunctional DNA-binding transcriptional regulator/antitoxin component of YhaV-PrlF toxin-antitoxin module
MMHLPSELRKRYRLSPGDRVELRPTKRGILLERIPTLMEGFGQYPGLGRRMAQELLEEKRAELAREERELVQEEARVRRSGRGRKVRA